MRFWQRLAMVGGFICCSAIGLWLTTVTAQAAVTDAPHNDSNGITCTSCHQYSFWWQYSPAKQRTDFTTLVDTLCFDCHKDGGTGPKALTHSSSVINSGLHDTWDPWDRACTTCHNPHHQDQLEWANSVPTPYLVIGDISDVSYNSGTQETTITYAAPINPVWPAVGDTDEDLDWANKSLANPGRGLILVQDTEKTSNTFSILAANASTVTVKGEITTNMIDPDYIDPVTNKQNSATCASFGLIYGDLIRASINARSVKFFDPNGGFVKDEGATPTGICQVCHTKTAHYANGGVMPDDTDSHQDRNNMNCAICHQHLKGFKGLGHDANSFAWAGNCATCHDSTKLDGTPVSIVDDIHSKKCGLCHLNAAGGGDRKIGAADNGTDASALDAIKSSTCVDCHLTKLGLTGATIHHVSANHYATDGLCINCHDNALGKLAAPHDTLASGVEECVSCHTATAGLAIGMPVSLTDSKVHDACLTCHNTDGTLLDPYGKAVDISGGTCLTCHGNYFLSHVNVNKHNDFLLKTGTSCESCHNQSGDTATDVVGTIHQGNCNNCHDAITHALINGTTVGYTKSGTTYMIGDARKHAIGSTSTCQTCHAIAWRDIHKQVDTHWDNVGDEAACLTCHAAANSPYIEEGEVHANASCLTCHNTAFGNALKGSALNHTVGQSSSCSTCHMVTSHIKIENQGQHAFTSNSNCLTCHTDMNTGLEVLDRHLLTGDCSKCHLAPPAPSGASAMDVFNNADPAHPELVHCEDCHAAPGDYKLHQP